MELGMKFNEIRAKLSILQVFPFNSEKKRGGVAVHVKDSEVHLHWKGAAEIVLSFCTSYLDSEGSIQPMDPQKMEDFKRGIEVMAEASLRCVAFAFRPFEMDKVPKEDQRSDWAIPEDELVLIGIAGIKDPFRPGVRDSVNLCTKAGVKVMGRSSPNGKLLFVRALRNRGHVVAITGDGTNDAPALHEADIGLSMGIQGTEVAKESSDIIILDDDFASVVKVVRWGRSVYDNIQKFIQFQPTVNVAALVINVVAAVSTGNVPLNAVQWWPGGCLCTFNCQRKNYDICLDDHSPLLCR